MSDTVRVNGDPYNTESESQSQVKSCVKDWDAGPSPAVTVTSSPHDRAPPGPQTGRAVIMIWKPVHRDLVYAVRSGGHCMYLSRYVPVTVRTVIWNPDTLDKNHHSCIYKYIQVYDCIYFIYLYILLYTSLYQKYIVYTSTYINLLSEHFPYRGTVS